MRHAAALFLAALLLCPGLATAAVLRADGQLDEEAWRSATPLEDFRQVEPLTLGAATWPVRARWLAREDGLWVGVEVATPPEIRTRGRNPRDARPLSADPVSVLVDFSGTGQGAAEFTVSLGGTPRDGLADATGQFSYDWDAPWDVGVAEQATGWSAEFRIPWNVAGAPPEGETRTLGLWVGTFVKSRGLRFAQPAVNLDNPAWLRQMQRIEVPRHAVSSLQFVPYVSLTADRVRDSLLGHAGADVTWNSGTGHQLTATLRPDFGQVESDDVVVNFSAVETFFSDKRPFFTEGSALFDVRLPDQVRLINTRRIGDRADGGGLAAPVDAALKYVGERGRWDVGAFAAIEGDAGDGGRGRDFGAIRLRHRGERGAVGYLGTWVDRPGLGYQARVDALDADFSLAGGLTLRGRAVTSRRLGGAIAGGDGHAAAFTAQFDDNGPFTWEIEATRLSRDFEIDDFGYLPRANLMRVETEIGWRRQDYPDGGLLQGSNWKAEMSGTWDAAGKRLQPSVELGRGMDFRNGMQAYGWFWLQGSGLDDLLTRGNGDVRVPARLSLGGWMQTGRFGPGRALEAELEGGSIAEGLGGTGWYLQVNPRWVVSEQVTLSGQVSYRSLPDWLLWQGGNALGAFRLREVYTGLGADVFFGTRHELRMRLQWLGLGAAGRQAYRAVAGEPVPEAGRPEDFSLATLAFQVRYRYSIGPLSDVYVVYGRGGELFETGRDRGLGSLWRDGLAQRDAEQWLVKIRYLF
ncbi:MAG: DUF5916 domain-containing protein [Gammaproteobacteria bacterium]